MPSPPASGSLGDGSKMAKDHYIDIKIIEARNLPGEPFLHISLEELWNKRAKGKKTIERWTVKRQAAPRDF